MTTALLLAAGQSRRFGAACKLQAIYRGKPLVRHAADAIIATGLPRIAVVADPAVARLLPEFQIIVSHGLQSHSLQAGLAQVATDRVLVVLGDMPHVDARLLLRVARTPAPAATTDGDAIGPPACLDRAMFPALNGLTGDQGAGAILRALPATRLIHVAPGTLHDIDRPGDLTPDR